MRSRKRWINFRHLLRQFLLHLYSISGIFHNHATKSYILLTRDFARVSCMAPKLLLLILCSIIIGLMIFLPVLPYSTHDTSLAALSQRGTASVSLSYSLTQCGMVYNPHVSSTIGSLTTDSNVWSGGRLVCGDSWARSS